MPECVRIADQWHEHTAEVELVKMCATSPVMQG